MTTLKSTISQGLAKTLIVGAFFWPAGCPVDGGTATRPVENPYNKALIRDAGNWMTNQMTGEFVSPPLFPIKVPYIPYDTAFSSVVRGPLNGIAGQPNRIAFSGALKFYGAGEIYQQPNQYTGYFVTDVSPNLNKKVWAQTGSYRVAYDLALVKHLDVAKVDVTYNDGTLAHGRADLPWQYTGTNGNLVGTDTVKINQQVWVQATADLPAPLSYSWHVGAATLSGSSSAIHDTVFTTPGSRYYSVTITGSNGAQVTIARYVRVFCPNGSLFMC